MELDTERRRELVTVVLDDWVGMGLSTFAKELLGSVEALVDKPPGLNEFRTAEWVVDFTLNKDRPDLFIGLVRKVDAAGALVELQALADKLKKDPKLWRSASAAGELWAPSEWPFVDRDALRKMLDRMVKGEGSGAICIEGSAGNGKRAVCAYIRQLSERSKAFKPVVVELRREPHPGALVNAVTDLRLKLDLDPDPSTTHAEPEREGELMARALAMEAPAAQMPVWFVANVVDPAGLEEAAIPFLDELLRLVAKRPELRKKLRVILLTESASQLNLKSLPGQKQRHSLPEIAQEPVAGWLASAVPGLDKEIYQDFAESMFLKIQAQAPEPAERLRAIALACVVARKTLAKLPKP